MASPRITIVLEIEPGESPVGIARLPEGPVRRFHGWLGLAEAVDALAGMAAGGDVSPQAPAGAGMEPGTGPAERRNPT